MGISAGCHDQSDRHLYFVVEFSSEEETDSGKFPGTFRGAHLPLACTVIKFFSWRFLISDGEKSDFWVIGIFQLFFKIIDPNFPFSFSVLRT